MATVLESFALRKFGNPFLKKVKEVSNHLNIQPDWLMQIMANESGLNPSRVNPQTGAVGLIQFMPFIAQKVLHTTTEKLKALSATKQLQYVQQFYSQPQLKGKLKSLESLYLAAFYPYALTQPDSFVIGSEKGTATARRIAQQNKGFDYNKDGWVTVEDYKNYVKHNLKPEEHLAGLETSLLSGMGEVNKYAIGDKIYAKGREFTIIDISPIGPNTKRARPEIEYNFIARGKRGAHIMGWIMEDGTTLITFGLSGIYDHLNDPFTINGSREGRGDIPYIPSLDPRKPTYKIRDNYDFLFSPAQNKTTFEADAGLQKTIATINKAAQTGREQVQELANYLKASSPEQSAYNVWHFLKTNIAYHLDTPGKEEIRTPNRSWKDRHHGIDCEDFSIFAHALLTDMGYHPVFNIVAFNHKKEFGHIFITLQDTKGKFTVDVVVGGFNEQAPNITKTMRIETLSGLPDEMINGLAGPAPADDFTLSVINYENRLKSRGINGLNQSEWDKELRKARYLKVLNGTEERDIVAAMMEYIDDISPKGNLILKAGADLVQMVEKIEHLEGIAGLSGRNKQQRKERRAKRKAEGKGIFRKAFKFIKKFSPVTVAIRNAFLLAMRINFLHIAKRIKYGYMTEEQARVAQLDMGEYEKLKGVIGKLEKLFIKIGGNKEKLRNAIIKGGKGLNGIERVNALTALHPSPLDLAGLGFAPVAAVTAALPLLKVIASLLKAVNFPKLLKKKDKKGDEESTGETAAEQTSADYEAGAQNQAVQDMSEVLPEDSSPGNGEASIQEFSTASAEENSDASEQGNQPDNEPSGNEELAQMSESQAGSQDPEAEQAEGMQGIGAFLDSLSKLSSQSAKAEGFINSSDAFIKKLKPVLQRRKERNPNRQKVATKIQAKKNALKSKVNRLSEKVKPVMQPSDEEEAPMTSLQPAMTETVPQETGNDQTGLLVGVGILVAVVLAGMK